MAETEHFNKKEREFMLNLARRTIEYFLKNGRKLEVWPQEIPSPKLIEDGACFVTLYIGKKKALRGCIGTLEAHRPIVMDIVNNAINAAFDDPRFHPVRQEELKDITIEISVLTKPEPLAVKDKDDLLKKLVPKKHGLIIQKGFHRATYLPIVWKEIPKKEDFLNELCQKAGLLPNEWKNTDEMTFLTYEAEEFEE
ncbi:MAG: AmmeMemoRadiSam system protein A [Candidatus Micrarchaeia archaeon]|jgi:AmmeMemoRadiSam system protein A